MELTVRQLRDHLAPFRKRSMSSALGHIAIMLSLYAAGFVGTLVAPWPIVQIALGLFTGICAGSLFMAGHDACHGSYTDRLLPAKIAIDSLYIARRSLFYDARILIWTFGAIALRLDVAVDRDSGELSVRRRPDVPSTVSEEGT